MTLLGSSRSSITAPRQYRRIGPTPWVSTSQPLGVSIGEPQLPILKSSHGCSGLITATGSSHLNIVCDVMSITDTSSCRDSM